MNDCEPIPRFRHRGPSWRFGRRTLDCLGAIGSKLSDLWREWWTIALVTSGLGLVLAIPFVGISMWGESRLVDSRKRTDAALLAAERFRRVAVPSALNADANTVLHVVWDGQRLREPASPRTTCFVYGYPDGGVASTACSVNFPDAGGYFVDGYR
jgi:hypothetical protein